MLLAPLSGKVQTQLNSDYYRTVDHTLPKPKYYLPGSSYIEIEVIKTYFSQVKEKIYIYPSCAYACQV